MSQSVKSKCFQCRHLIITFQIDRRYACRAMGFKSRVIPWKAVYKSSGMPCQLFEPKPPRGQNHKL